MPEPDEDGPTDALEVLARPWLADACNSDPEAVDKLLNAIRCEIRARIATLLATRPLLLGRPQTSEDYTQEVLERIRRNLASFVPRGRRSFTNWVRTVSENLLHNAQRRVGAAKRGRRAAHFTGSDTACTLASPPLRMAPTPPDQALARKERLAQVWRTVDLLPTEERAVVRRFLESEGTKDYTRWSAQLAVSKRTLARRLARGLAHLHASLPRENGEGVQ